MKTRTTIPRRSAFEVQGALSQHFSRQPISLLLISFIVLSGTFGCYGQGPADVVADFNEALRAQDKAKLVRFLTNEPESVSRRAFAEFQVIYPAVKEKTETTPPSGVNVASGPSFPTFEGEKLVDRVVFADLFLADNRLVGHVQGVRIHGNEAVVTVLYTRSETQDGPSLPLKYDILLYKQPEGWRIFLMNHRRKGDDAYYQYRFYAQGN